MTGTAGFIVGAALAAALWYGWTVWDWHRTFGNWNLRWWH
jgi:hypothetical protein